MAEPMSQSDGPGRVACSRAVTRDEPSVVSRTAVTTDALPRSKREMSRTGADAADHWAIRLFCSACTRLSVQNEQFAP